ncbi:hypothetical protein DICSQDRAFT_173963 [Dichomitus squalens LYAD-421 SS1]|uniref:Uncharacterized protein n=1 Tax=Dichomitus squalens (strain LYAD-421) TaxID=732165 RepID=R7SR06_DICSQ|nr:uncharacterized protein DICSQDRAFT_173963 [Dichomitus squalens LYAD-421 SS1]EJF57412.1 hypothetical protein DICSQDRAFT_173963 [Dichomitus squalens LYAD-421 SS1]
MVIPREGDLVRLYIQLADRDLVTGRVDKSRINDVAATRRVDSGRRSATTP